ncbi:MAG: hypothetical protein CBC55_04645 [Gammaproteobacteria bacterium TMED95]|nr:MAG: hypothetical protein CBC55_04645 [Gammaproteobacteria bacterium TMED95]|tara:strand:+ start:5020 stop:5673 length:654 start_codon:yes stop_codon:yes gene_type:complete
MEVNKKTLLSAAHIIDYALAFNETNSQLAAIQTRHFQEAGKDILTVRDPFTAYESAKEDQCWLLEICDIENSKALIGALNDSASEDAFVDVEDKSRLFRLMSEAITRYNERHLYFMLEHEYEEDLIGALGVKGYNALRAELNAYLNKHLICGNADSSIRRVKALLEDNGAAYTKPSAPYMQKHDARFADMHARIRASFKKSVKEDDSSKEGIKQAKS